MILRIAKRLETLAPESPGACFAALAFALLLYFPVVAGFSFVRSGWNGIVAAMVAAGVCWIAATLALTAVVIVRDPKQGVAGALAGMLIRMSLPLVAGVVLSRQGGMLAEAGVFGLIVAFYLFTLVVETWLSVSLVARRTPKAAAV